MSRRVSGVVWGLCVGRQPRPLGLGEGISWPRCTEACRGRVFWFLHITPHLPGGLQLGSGERIASGPLETGAGFSSAAKSVVSVFTSSEGVEALRNLGGIFWGSVEIAHRYCCTSSDVHQACFKH